MKTALELIAEERARQIAVEGYDTSHDDQHEDGALAVAGACYAIAGHEDGLEFPMNDSIEELWPWDEIDWKPKDRIRNLVRAGALILAEIERLHRTPQ